MLKVASFIALFAITTAGAADARTVRKAKINNWDISVHTREDLGRVTHCTAAAKYRNGVTLLFSVNRRLAWAIGFASRAWKLTPGKNYKVTYKIDDGAVYTGTGQAISTMLVRMGLPHSQKRFNEFRLGASLAVRAGNDFVKFKLTDTANMLTALRECVKRRRRN